MTAKKTGFACEFWAAKTQLGRKDMGLAAQSLAL
jgi:hypothetical protein